MDKLNKIAEQVAEEIVKGFNVLTHLQACTESIINFTIERHRFKLNQGKPCYIWTYNLDVKHARIFLASLNFKTRIRYKFFIVKKLNEKGDFKIWHPQIRRQIQFIYNTYDF